MTTAATPAELFDRHTQEFLEGNPPTAVARAAGPTANRADAVRWLRGAAVPDRLQRSRLARSKKLRRGLDFAPRWGRLWGVELWHGLEETDHQVAQWLDVFGDWGGDFELAEALGVDPRTVRQWFHGEKRSRRADEVQALVESGSQHDRRVVGDRPPMPPTSRAVEVTPPSPASQVGSGLGPIERRALLQFAREVQAAAAKLAAALESQQ
ncbi:MAG: helix-turn-helix domain-containing protein [Acidimicrobiia bacterium]|nr:helix-turn-helix domain-containing protein [Acidimicrobiia bacterium]